LARPRTVAAPMTARPLLSQRQQGRRHRRRHASRL